MKPEKLKRHYLLVFIDDAAQTFNITGPVFDSDDCDGRTCDLRATGRKVRIWVLDVQLQTLDRIHPENFLHRAPEGYRFDPYLYW